MNEMTVAVVDIAVLGLVALGGFALLGIMVWRDR